MKEAETNGEALYWEWMHQTGARHASYDPLSHAMSDKQQADARVKNIEDAIEAQTGKRPGKLLEDNKISTKEKQDLNAAKA